MNAGIVELGGVRYRTDEDGRLCVDDLKATHPIEGPVKGWYFRVLERSEGCHIAWGIDARGRRESANGTTPAEALEACARSVEIRLQRARLRRKQRLAGEAAAGDGPSGSDDL